MDEVNFDFAKFCRGSGVGNCKANAENFNFDEFCRDDGKQQPPSPGVLAKDVKIVRSKIRGLLMNFVRTLSTMKSEECDDAMLSHLQRMNEKLLQLIGKMQARTFQD